LTGLQIAQALVEAPSTFSHREPVQPECATLLMKRGAAVEKKIKILYKD
jgi:hypothetical protein